LTHRKERRKLAQDLEKESKESFDLCFSNHKMQTPHESAKFIANQQFGSYAFERATLSSRFELMIETVAAFCLA